MAQLPSDFAVQPRNEIDPHTLGEQPGPMDAPPREEWPAYIVAGTRWDIYNDPPPRLGYEDYRMWLGRLYNHARLWAQEDERDGSAAKAARKATGDQLGAGRGRGRPPGPTLPGETPEERKKRLNREAQERYRRRNVVERQATYSVEKAAMYAEWEAVTKQLDELKARADALKAQLDNTTG